MSERNTSGREFERRIIAFVKTALGLKANASDLARVATTGSYNDLSNKPTIPTVPTKTSDLTNDSGYQTATQVQTAIAAAAELPTGGSTGDFLRKTSSGVAWETVQTWQGGSY